MSAAAMMAEEEQARHCLATHCYVKIKKTEFFCRAHWQMVPPPVKNEVFEHIGKNGLRDALGTAVRYIGKVQDFWG